jgi:NifU-like protein
MAKAVESEEDELICKCFQVTEAKIRTCIAEYEITEIEEVTNQCEAGGNCQTCHILIQLFIDQHQQDKAVEKAPESVSAKTQNKGFFGKLFANA